MFYKRLSFTVLVILAVMVSGVGFSQSEISWGTTIDADIQKQLTQVVNIYALDVNYAAQNKDIFRTWVSGSMDLSALKPRVSKVFNRSSYTQEVTADKLRLPTEKLNLVEEKSNTGVKIKPRLETQNIQKITLKRPATVIFREADNNFSFLKFKELAAANPLETKTAQTLAKTFLQQNRLLTETAEDKIGRMYIQNRRITEEVQQGKENDFLVQQDIVFERYFQNKPVINSKIVVGIVPGNKEIVLFKHYNWTTANLKQVKPVSSEMLKAASATSVAQIKQKLAAKFTGKSIKAKVNRVNQAWFQTKDSLIPVLVFDVYTEYKSEIGVLSRNSMEVVNLAGSDSALYPKRPTAKQPTAPN